MQPPFLPQCYHQGNAVDLNKNIRVKYVLLKIPVYMRQTLTSNTHYVKLNTQNEVENLVNSK